MHATRALLLVGLLGSGAALGCDEAQNKAQSAAEAAAPLATAAVPPTPEPPRAPDIVIDGASVAVGSDRVASGELGLADKVAVFLKGRPMIEGNTVNVVAMRNAKPSQVAAVIAALHKAKASGATVKTDARDGTTQPMPVSFTASVADCATAAWIGKDAAIEVWPAGGGTAKRVTKGLAGPDMTLGTEAMRKQWSTCGASELVVGADDLMSWGLVFDLARAALEASGTHVTTTVLVTNASPGRKATLD
jgi:hypothetical protein